MARVTRLPHDTGPAGWNELLPAPAPATVLEGAQTADWLVIGAGLTGSAAARRLAQLCPGDQIALLDATRVAEGPAGRNSGFMIDLPHNLGSKNYSGTLETDRTVIEDNRRAIDFAGEMASEFGLSDEAFKRSGRLNAAASAKGVQLNQSYARHLDDLGEHYRMLDATEMRAITGSDYYQGGLYTPGAAMIQPAAFVRGIAGGLVSNRVHLYENSPVTGLEKRGDWVATTPNGQLTAPKVILAVNGHLNSFGYMSGRLMHVFTYASMTRALTPDEVARLGGDRMWAATPSDPMGTSVRRICGTGGDRILIRNRFTFEPEMEVAEKQIADVARDHDRAFAARFPMLGDMSMDYRWGGRLCLSLNNVQVIDELEDGLCAACCHNGLGTVRGVLAGMLAAEHMTGQSTAALDRALAADQPKRLPPQPLATMGASLRLKFGEWRAGREL